MTTSGLGLSIAVLAFGASTIYLAVQLNDERAHSEQLVEETRALNARIATLEMARAQPLQAVSGTFGAINMTPGRTFSASSAPPVARTEARPGQLQSVVVNGPSMLPNGEAFRKMIRSQMRAQNKQMYADVGTELGLNRQDTNKLIDLLTDQNVDGIAISRDSTDPTETARLVNEARRANEAKIAELLGTEKLELLEQYQKTIPLRHEVDMIARQLDGTDAPPLSDDQRKRLLAALVEERNRVPAPDYQGVTPGEDFKNSYINWHDEYNTRVAAHVRTILDAEQYSAYDEFQQWQKEMNVQMRATAGGRGTVMYSAAPGTIVGEVAIATESVTDENPRKEP